ncbi:MAG TPA: GNAT family N-acetyltransferase [Acidimicrobiales bacterium]|nr:GNAT family N-acetyltransferase [Acidimicrobiales bacterium]
MTLVPSPVRTERLTLRPLTENDVESLVAYRSLDEVCRYVPFSPMDAETVRARLGRFFGHGDIGGEGQAIVLGVELSAQSVLIGDLLAHWSSEEHKSAEIGYVFHPAYGGRGYAAEGVHRLLHLVFDGLGIHRVTARVDLRNAPSARLLRRVGMREEAHLKENEWFKGGWSDELDFAVLEQEWRAQHAHGCPDLARRSPPTVLLERDLADQDLRDADVEIYDGPIGVKLLYRHPVTGAEHYLIRYPAGLVATTHRHRAAHTFVVLEGALEVNGECVGPGSYAHFPAGSVMHHAPAGDEGCLFVAVFDGAQDVEPLPGDPR